MKGMRAWIAGGMLACSALSAACAAILGFDPLVEGSEQPDAQETLPDASSDAGVDAAPPPSNCVEKLVRPAVSNGQRTRRNFAFNALVFRPLDDAGTRPGLDLDCVDTAEPDPTFTCANATLTAEALDSPGGVDNAAGKVFDFVVDSIDFNSFDRRVKSGDVGMVFSILADFARGGAGVSVDAYPARGMEVAGQEGCERRDAGNVPATADAGRVPLLSDRWCVDNRFEDPGTDRSTMRTDYAWIDGDRFVARFDKLMIPLLGRGADSVDETDDPVTYITLHNAWLVARIDRSNESQLWLRDGTIGGRWQIDDILGMYAAALDRTNCGLDPAVLRNLGGQLCTYQDITIEAGAPATDACNAISIGMSFDAYQMTDDGDFASVTIAEDECFADAAAAAAEAGVPLVACPPAGTR